MKVIKTIVGIISIILSLFIIIQSCAVGIGNELFDNGEVSGSAGLIVGAFMLIAGTIGIAVRSSKVGGFVSGIFYLLGGIVGIICYGTYSDLKIWSIVSFVFAVIFIIGSIFQRKEKNYYDYYRYH